MKLKNFERELKYLINDGRGLDLKKLFDVFYASGYSMVESRRKKKTEAYYDDEELSVIKRGNVIRRSTHFNKDGLYFHFMFKKNVSDPVKPYVSKYEFGSDQFKSVQEFITELGFGNIEVQPEPVLYAEMTRETVVFEKDGRRLLISYDNVKYYKDMDGTSAHEIMLEVEDWTTPYTTIAEKEDFDTHLLSINDILLNKLPIQLTKDSKPYRGFLLLGENGFKEHVLKV